MSITNTITTDNTSAKEPDTIANVSGESVAEPQTQTQAITTTKGNNKSKNRKSNPDSSIQPVASYQQIVEQFEAAIAQWQAVFDLNSGDYNAAFQVHLAITSLFLDPKYQPYLAELPYTEIEALHTKVYTWLISASIEIANHFASTVDLSVPAQLAPLNRTSSLDALIYSMRNSSGGDITSITTTPGMITPAEIAVSSKQQWRQTQVQTLVTEPIPAKYFLGKEGLNKSALALTDSKLAVTIVKLLGRYGAMTNFQIRSLLTSMDYDKRSSQTNSLNVRVFEALHLLRFAGAITTGDSDVANNPTLPPAPGRVIVYEKSVQEWGQRRGRPAVIWALGGAGQLWYKMLTKAKYVPGANSISNSFVLLPHTYGIQQVLAGLRSLVNVDNQLQALPQMLNQLGLLEAATGPTNTTSATGSSNGVANSDTGEAEALSSRRFRLEVEEWATSLQLSHNRGGLGTQGLLIPDAIGHLVVDSDKPQIEAALLATSTKLDPDLDINKFAYLPRYGQMTFPFFLEYDRDTETSLVFAEEKYPKYTDIFNAPPSSAWLPQWGTKFPVVLVVTEGSSSHLLSLVQAIIEQRRVNKQQKAFVYWWFTTSRWFASAYQPYMDKQLSGQWEQFLAQQAQSSKPRKNGRKPLESQPPLGHDPRCWLSLGSTVGVKLEEIEAVERYYRAGPEAALPPLLSKMSAIPLPHPFNMPIS